MTSESFYLYLPSSVNNTRIVNKLNHFVTKLQQIKYLDTSREYEVALISLSYPRTVFNAYYAYITYWSWEIEAKVELSSLADGQYNSALELIEEIHVALGSDAKYYKFTFDSRRNKISVLAKRKEGSKEGDILLKMSPNLQILTGFTAPIDKEGNTTAELEWDVTGGMGQIFCYSNIVASDVTVGDASAPLLFSTAYNNKGDFGQQILYEVRNPVYVPVAVDRIEDIEIEFRNKTSEYFKFTSGEVVLLLNIRAKPNFNYGLF